MFAVQCFLHNVSIQQYVHTVYENRHNNVIMLERERRAVNDCHQQFIAHTVCYCHCTVYTVYAM